MKRQLTIRLAALAVVLAAGVVSARAQTFTVGDIEYKVTTSGLYEYDEVSVIDYLGSGGHVSIRELVGYEGYTFKVTSIGSSAFSGCTGLTSIALPGSVTRIGGSAFYGCTGLTSIDIPDGVTSIEYWAFEGCTGLTSIELPAGLKSIGVGAFEGCTGLTSIELPAGLESIRSGAFSGCTGLTSIDLPAGLTYISGFSGCTGLTSIELPAGLTYISGFSGCTGLTSIELPAGLDSIGSYAFSGITGLTSIDIPDGVTYIGQGAFKGCTGLTSIDIPDGVEVLEPWTFTGCTELRSVKLPESLKELKSLSIYDNGSGGVFSGCRTLASIDIPDGVTSIGSYAFYGCTGLTSITLPAGLRSIGQYAFSGCTGLTSITLPAGLRSIGNYAFSGFTGLTSIDIPDGVTSIGSYAFYGCTSLASVDFPDGLEVIEYCAFSGCTGLASVDFPDGLEVIKSNAFEGCTGLASVDFGDGVTSIGRYAFSGCTGLASIDIPDGVTSMGYDVSAFSKYIDEYAFEGCTGLTSIELPNSLVAISGGVFSGCTGLTSIDFPDGLKIIGGFSGCTGLTSIEIPFSVTRIGDYAFSGCTGLTSIDLPASLTGIGYKAFGGCTGLASIVSAVSSSCSVGRDVFYNTDIRCAVFLSNSLAGKIPFSAGSEVFVFGDNSVDNLRCDKLYTFKSSGFNFLSCDELVRLRVGDLVYTGKPQRLSIEGNTSSAEMELLSESAVDAGTYTVGEVAFSFRYDEYGIDIPEVRAKKVTYTIRKAPLDVSVSPSSAAITYGESCPEFNVEYDGFVNGEGEEVLSSLPTVACEGNLDVGTHSVTASGGEAKNYDFNYIPGELTVNKATLTVTGESYTVTYGDELPEFGYEISGFVLGEDESVLDALPEVRTLSNPSAGEYTLDISGGSAKNYGFDYRPGMLTVLRAPQSISWEQDFTSGLVPGMTVELGAVSSSGLGVSYMSRDEGVVRIVESGGKPYAECVSEGVCYIIATQPGDRNHEAAPAVTKRVDVTRGSGLRDASALSIGCRPSPALDVLEVTGTSAGMACAVYDLSGAPVLSSRCADGSTRLDVSRLAPGAYVLVVAGGDGAAVARLRFAKE